MINLSASQSVCAALTRIRLGPPLTGCPAWARGLPGRSRLRYGVLELPERHRFGAKPRVENVQVHDEALVLS